jgi:peroxiredoxin Q/BCP
MTLQVNDAAPDFELPDQDRAMQRLSDLRGRWVLLYFYPKDDTPGCTAEACGFRDAYADLKDKVTILGVSADTVSSHVRFREKYHLPFPLLADPDRNVHNLYGVGSTYGKRVSFLINRDGRSRMSTRR